MSLVRSEPNSIYFGPMYPCREYFKAKVYPNYVHGPLYPIKPLKEPRKGIPRGTLLGHMDPGAKCKEVWCLARPAFHAGASGVVCGYLGVLIPIRGPKSTQA